MNDPLDSATLINMDPDPDFSQVKFVKKTDLMSVDWKSINRKLEEHNKLKDQRFDEQDLLLSMFDETQGSKFRRETLATLNPSSIKKIKNMVKQKREKKDNLDEKKESTEFLKEFQVISEMLENKRNIKERELEKLIKKSPDYHQRQK